MTQAGNSPISDSSSNLRDELMACDATLEATRPVLRHLVAVGENFLLSEEIVARVRSMVSDVARQLLRALAEAVGDENSQDFEGEASAALLTGLLDQPALLHHAHALAVETQLGEFFRIRSGIDPVLAPLLQNLIASNEPKASALAMAVLAAQARFVQSQRRMELPLRELPGNLHEAVLSELRQQAPIEADAATDQAIAALRNEFDESSSRLSLLSDLVTSLDDGPASALSIEQAGVASFVTALAMGAQQARDAVILATDAGQSTRLALMLRIAGLSPQAVATQLLTLHPELAPPAWLAELTAEQARALLAPAAPSGVE